MLKLLLFIFLKDKSIVRQQKNIVKNFRVSYVHIEVIQRDQAEGLHIIVMIWIWQHFSMVDEAIYQHLCIWTLYDNWQSLKSIVDASVGLYSLFITFIWKHRNFIVTEHPPGHIHSSANLSSFAFLWHQGNNKVMSF